MPNNPFMKLSGASTPNKVDAESMDNFKRASLQGRPLQLPSREMGLNMRDLEKVNVGFNPIEYDPGRSVPDPTFELTNQKSNTANRDVTSDLNSKYLEKIKIFRNNPFARTAERIDFRPYANKYKGG